MKKLLILVLAIACIFSISGCSTQSNLDGYIANQEITISFPFGERAGVYTGEVNSNGLPEGLGSFTAINDEGTEWTYYGDWKNGLWDGLGITKWDTGGWQMGEFDSNGISGYNLDARTENISFGYIENNDANGYYTINFADGSTFFGYFTDSINATGFVGTQDHEFIEAEIINGILITSNPNLSTTTDSTSTATDYPDRDNDFFSDASRLEVFQEYYDSYQLSALYNYVNDYIADVGPTENDSAFDIAYTLSCILDYESSWDIQFDEFDGSYTLSFPGADSIAAETNVSAYIDENHDATVFIGFEDDDWLFFDHYAISVDGEVIKSGAVKSYDTVTDVLDGGRIKESVKISVKKDLADAIINADTVILRFSNGDNEETLDFSLSEQEIKALYCSAYVPATMNELSNILSTYNSPLVQGK